MRVYALGDAAKVLLLAEAPRAEVLAGEHGLVVAVAKLDVIDAGLAHRPVNRAHGFQREMGIVRQSAVTDGAVDNLDFWAKHHDAPQRQS
jgi:hypothetical protein